MNTTTLRTLFPLSDGHGLLALFQSVTGVMPSAVDIEGYPPGYDWGGLTSYTWSDVTVMVLDDGRADGIAILASAVNGVPIRTEGGISVGSSRAEVLAAQGWDKADEDGDGVADYMGLDSREVPGTQSLVHSGSVGVEYLLLVMNGDTVRQIQAPGNDFSDI